MVWCARCVHSRGRSVSGDVEVVRVTASRGIMVPAALPSPRLGRRAGGGALLLVLATVGAVCTGAADGGVLLRAAMLAAGAMASVFCPWATGLRWLQRKKVGASSTAPTRVGGGEARAGAGRGCSPADVASSSLIPTFVPDEYYGLQRSVSAIVLASSLGFRGLRSLPLRRRSGGAGDRQRRSSWRLCARTWRGLVVIFCFPGSFVHFPQDSCPSRGFWSAVACVRVFCNLA